VTGRAGEPAQASRSLLQEWLALRDDPATPPGKEQAAAAAYIRHLLATANWHRGGELDGTGDHTGCRPAHPGCCPCSCLACERQAVTGRQVGWEAEAG
jgi:hypothetical protein